MDQAMRQLLREGIGALVSVPGWFEHEDPPAVFGAAQARGWIVVRIDGLYMTTAAGKLALEEAAGAAAPADGDDAQ